MQRSARDCHIAALLLRAFWQSAHMRHCCLACGELVLSSAHRLARTATSTVCCANRPFGHEWRYASHIVSPLLCLGRWRRVSTLQLTLGLADLAWVLCILQVISGVRTKCPPPDETQSGKMPLGQMFKFKKIMVFRTNGKINIYFLHTRMNAACFAETTIILIV